MMDDIIDNAIAEATVTEAPVPVPVVEEASAEQPLETPEAPVSEVEEISDTPDAPEAPVEFPKKAVNALARRDKKINKLQAQLQELQRNIQPQNNPQEAATVTQPADGAPSEEQFETYGEFLKAQIKHEMGQESSQRDKQAQSQQLENQQQEWVQQRQASLAEQIQTEASTIPDFADVWAENTDILDDLPEHVEMAFYEADNAPLAIYTLAKEGSLENLATMSPAKAAMEIGRAQIRAEAAAKSQTTSNAPVPISGAKGTAKTDKSLSDRSPEELLKWLAK